jgi:hypothetical protein
VAIVGRPLQLKMLSEGVKKSGLLRGRSSGGFSASS